METKKLYYEDGNRVSFTATVLSCEQVPEGWAIRLDQTAFYPGGGGQAWDLGTLGDVRVIACQEEGNVHICDGFLAVGSTVNGCIQWDRRFDQMQQHTGEHILSGLVHRKYGYHNVGFHVGADTVTVDFDGMIPAGELESLEAQANQIIWQNLPVQIYTPDPDALAQLTYRTKRPLAWPVRIVEIPQVDRCACCAVHVGATGQVGLVKILSCVKFHQGVRMEIVCGGRAFSCLTRLWEQNRKISAALSAKPFETADATLQLCARLEKEKLRGDALQDRAFASVAQSYAGKGDCFHYAPSLSPDQLRRLCDRIAACCGGTAAVLTDREGGSHICIIGEKAGELGRSLCLRFGGKGGGKPGYFQGSLDGTPETVVHGL